MPLQIPQGYTPGSVSAPSSTKGRRHKPAFMVPSLHETTAVATDQCASLLRPRHRPDWRARRLLGRRLVAMSQA